jgi:hypothetical protein
MTFKMGLQSGFATTAMAAAILLAAGVAGWTASRPLDEPKALLTASAAQELFADAPDGVDPMVTGPVPASFKQRQKDAGCDKAVWPNTPIACYPAK